MSRPWEPWRPGMLSTSKSTSSPDTWSACASVVRWQLTEAAAFSVARYLTTDHCQLTTDTRRNHDGPDHPRAVAALDRRPHLFAFDDALWRSDQPGDRRSDSPRAVRQRRRR